MEDQLERYRDEMQKELASILGYWMEFAVDNINGGFAGSAKNKSNPGPGQY